MTKFVLATLDTATGPRAGMGIGSDYYVISELRPLFEGVTVMHFLKDWEASFRILQELANMLGGETTQATKAPLLTPVMYPNKLMAVGANYAGHLKEMGLGVQKWDAMPFFFRPPNTNLVGPGRTVIIPKSTQQFDWECELAIVAGKKLKDASRDEAADAVAGYTIGLDLSCRDLIRVDNDLKIDLVRGKAQDTMAPCGPHLVPKQFMPDIENLRIQLFVNEQKMMDASSSEMLFKVDEILSIISHFVTIDPGDVVFTGSPAGSAGHHGNCWLKSGDTIRAEIDGIAPLNVTMQ